MIMEEKVGFGRYQYQAFLSLAFIEIADGMDIIAMSLIGPHYKEEWKLGSFETGAISCLFFFGMLVGAIMCAKFSD